VDGAAAAIEIVRKKASERGLTVDARVADLEKREYRIAPQAWDLITICYYLQRDLFEPAKLGVKPGGLLLAIVHVTDGTFDTPRRVALGAFVVLAAAYTIALAQRRRAPALAAGALSAAAAVLVCGALAWGGGTFGAVPLLVQLVVLAVATGGVFAAMILGHWYLVTPKLPEAPLILIARSLLAVVALQLLLFGVWVATGAGPAGASPFGVLVGQWALFVWLRLIIGLVFPLVVSWAAVKTARSRSMESATGLLYINVGSIAAGTILAAGLYFGAGVLV